MTSVQRAEDGQPRFVFGDGLPFGHEVVEALQDANATEPLKVPEVRRVIQESRLALWALRNSDYPVDQESARGIESRFKHDHVGMDMDTFQGGKVRGSILSHLHRANYAAWLEMCQWNVDRHAKVQAALDSATPQFKSAIAERVGRLRAAGVIDHATAKQYAVTLGESSAWQALDWFEAGGQGIDGRCTREGVVGLANQFVYPYGLDSGFKVDTPFHETAHQRGARFDSGLIFGPVRWPMAEESVVSHLTDLACDPSGTVPEPEVFNPLHRSSRAKSYQSLRMLVANLMQYGPEPIETELLLDGFHASGRRQSYALNQLATQFEAATQKLLPEAPGGWDGLNHLYGKAHAVHRKELVSSLTIIAIGRVIQRGEFATSLVLGLRNPETNAAANLTGRLPDILRK